MRLSPALCWTLALGVSAGTLWVCGGRAASARAHAIASGHDLDRTVGAVSELRRLKAGTVQPRVDAGGAQGLAERVSAVIATAALPASSLAGLAPASATPVTGPDGRRLAERRRATLTLSSLTLPQVGGFLAAWRAAEPGWAVASLELAPLGGGAVSDPAGGDLPLRAVVGLEAVVMSKERER